MFHQPVKYKASPYTNPKSFRTTQQYERKERDSFESWHHSDGERRNLERDYEFLQQELDALKEKIKARDSTHEYSNETRQREYFNEEKESSKNITFVERRNEIETRDEKNHYERETNWNRDVDDRNLRKRKLEESPIVTTEKPLMKNKSDSKRIYISPIFVEDTRESLYQEISDQMSKSSWEGKITPIPDKGLFKIQCYSDEGYRGMRAWIYRSNIICRQLTNKYVRSFQVMAKGLYYKTDPREIYNEFIRNGFLITRAANVFCNRTKRPLNIFKLTFDEKQDPKAVYDVKTINFQKVLIEEVFVNPNRAFQYENQKNFNQTDGNYYNRKSFCVECGKDHESSQCQSTTENSQEYTIRKRTHTTNYKNHLYSKESENIRIENITEKMVTEEEQYRKQQMEIENVIEKEQTDYKMDFNNHKIQKLSLVPIGPQLPTIGSMLDIIQQTNELLNKQEERLSQQEQRLNQLNQQLNEQEKRSNQQDHEIKQIKQQSNQQCQMLIQQERQIKEHDQQLNQQEQKSNEQEQRLNKLDENVLRQERFNQVFQNNIQEVEFKVGYVLDSKVQK